MFANFNAVIKNKLKRIWGKISPRSRKIKFKPFLALISMMASYFIDIMV